MKSIDWLLAFCLTCAAVGIANDSFLPATTYQILFFGCLYGKRKSEKKELEFLAKACAKEAQAAKEAAQ